MRSRWDEICSGQGDGARAIFGTPESEAKSIFGCLSGCSNRKGLLKNFFNVGTFQGKAFNSGNDDDIIALGQDGRLLLRRRANDAADAISLRGIAQLFADGQPQPSATHSIFSPIDHQRFMDRIFSLMVCPFEVHVLFNAFDSHWISFSQ